MWSGQVYGYLILFFVVAGCSDGDIAEKNSRGEEEQSAIKEFLLRISPEEYVDSAQVFFFRELGSADTLIYREVIYDLEYLKPHLFHFELPAGKYTMIVFGNVPTEYLVEQPPYTQADIWFDYNHGRQPGVVYYGRTVVNAGTDTVNVSGMVLISSAVKLTIQKVPRGISRIIVRLLNTAAGLTLNAGYIEQPANPPLTDTLVGILSDSTYQAAFYCFPGVGTDIKSRLEVICYDTVGKVAYTGQSALFEVRPGNKFYISCSFGAPSLRTKDNSIYFRME